MNRAGGSPLTGGEFFAEPQQGDSPSADGGDVAAPAAGTTPYPRRGEKRKGHLRFPFLFELLPFPCFLIWRRLPTCDRCEIGERQSGYRSVSFSVFSQFTDRLLLHIRLTLRRRGITVPRNSLARCNARHLRIRRLVQFIFAGAVYHNALSNCAALLCLTQRRVARMCSRTLSDPANRLRKTRKKKSSAVLLFAAVTCRQSAPD